MPQDVQGAHAAPLRAAVQPGQQEGQQAVRRAARCRAGVSQAVRTRPTPSPPAPPVPARRVHAGPVTGPRGDMQAQAAVDEEGSSPQAPRHRALTQHGETAQHLLLVAHHQGAGRLHGHADLRRGQRTGQGGRAVHRCAAHTLPSTPGFLNRCVQVRGASRPHPGGGNAPCVDMDAPGGHPPTGRCQPPSLRQPGQAPCQRKAATSAPLGSHAWAQKAQNQGAHGPWGKLHW